MPADQGPFYAHNPWPRIAWFTAAIVISVSLVLGLLILSPYQQNGPRLDTWAAICRSLGITANVEPAAAPQPPLRVPSLIAWTPGTLNKIGAGDAIAGPLSH
jgi:hypothetical protein